MFVAGALEHRAVGFELRQQSALRLARPAVGIDRARELVESGPRQLAARQALAVFAGGFAADAEGHAAQGQQVALVGGVDGEARRDAPPIAQAQLRQALAQTGPARQAAAGDLDAIELDAAPDLHAGLRQPGLDHRFSDAGLEAEGRFEPRLLPGRARTGVAGRQPQIELARQAADGGGVAHVGRTEAAGAEAPQVCVGREHQRLEAVAFGLDRGRQAARGRVVDHQVHGPGRAGGIAPGQLGAGCIGGCRSRAGGRGRGRSVRAGPCPAASRNPGQAGDRHGRQAGERGRAAGGAAGFGHAHRLRPAAGPPRTRAAGYKRSEAPLPCPPCRSAPRCCPCWL